MQFGNPGDSILQSRFGAIRGFEPKMVRSSTRHRLFYTISSTENVASPFRPIQISAWVPHRLESVSNRIGMTLSSTKAEAYEIPVLPTSPKRDGPVSVQFFRKASEPEWRFPQFHHVEGRRSIPVSPWSFHGFSLPTGQWPSHRRIPFSV